MAKTTFAKGQSGNPRGRPKGAKNKASLEIRTLSRRLLSNRDYLKNLRKRLREGTAGHVETLLHHYAFGKPPETFLHQGKAAALVIDVVKDPAAAKKLREAERWDDDDDDADPDA
jgi:hypothetical protein